MTTMAAWMAYGLVVSGLLTAAALLAERSARAAGRATRWLWAGALAGSVVVPLAAWLWPAGQVAMPVEPPMMLRLQPIVLDAAASGGGTGLDTWLGVGWLAGTMLVAALLLVAAVRLQRARRSWREAELDGESVLISADVGPAVVGLGRGRIVVPEWVLGIEHGLRRLLLLHEREHLRAGDPRLLVLGLSAIVCAPWNPFLWLQLLRLRLAVEIDCDARVLHVSGDARGYGTLLLEVGRHRGAGATLAVAFGEPRRFLEERIRMIPRALGRRRLVRAGVLGVASAAVLLLAVCARDPISSVDPMERARTADEAAVPGGDVSDTPRFTPFTHRPELANREDVQQALEASYPPLLREAGIGGQSLVWFFIDETGSVAKTAINRSSGYAALDSAALQVARTMRFTPAMNEGENVPVWVAIPIVFSAGDGAVQGEPRIRRKRIESTDPGYQRTLTDSTYEGSASDSRPSPPPSVRGWMALRSPAGAPSPDARELEAGPTATPFTDAPRLRDRMAIADLMEANYPPLLRDAGIGGSTEVWLLIERDGRVKQVKLERSSGYEALDQAALTVASQMAFTPALKDAEPVPVWIQVPIVFAAR